IEGAIGLAYALETQRHLVSAHREPQEMSGVRYEVVQTRVEAEPVPELEHVRAAAGDVMLLEHEHTPPHSRQDGSAGEAAHAATDHEGVEICGDLLDPIAVRADAAEHVLALGPASRERDLAARDRGPPWSLPALVETGDPGIRSRGCDEPTLTPEAPMPVTGWDHVSFPARDPEAILDFYKRLGFETIHEEEFLSGKYPVFAIAIGANAKLNFHGPAFWQDPNFDARGRTALPGCGDFCFVFDGTIEEAVGVIEKAGATVAYGPFDQPGGADRG